MYVSKGGPTVLFTDTFSKYQELLASDGCFRIVFLGMTPSTLEKHFPNHQEYTKKDLLGKLNTECPYPFFDTIYKEGVSP